MYFFVPSLITRGNVHEPTQTKPLETLPNDEELLNLEGRYFALRFRRRFLLKTSQAREEPRFIKNDDKTVEKKATATPRGYAKFITDECGENLSETERRKRC